MRRPCSVSARPGAFALHARPLNRVLSEHGLPRLGLDLLRVYTEADHTLYADVPELIPTVNLPSNHHFLGPILWSPAVSPPEWWAEIPRDRPLIYATLGSSGHRDMLAATLEALADVPVVVVAATAGRSRLSQIPANAGWPLTYPARKLPPAPRWFSAMVAVLPRNRRWRPADPFSVSPATWTST